MYLKDLLFYHFIATSFKSNQSYIMQRSTKRKEAARTEWIIPGNEKICILWKVNDNISMNDLIYSRQQQLFYSLTFWIKCPTTINIL